MSALDIIQLALNDEVNMVLSSEGTVKLKGKKSNIQKWLPIVQANKLTVISHLENKEILFRFVSDCCSGFRTDPNFIIDHLLSVEDEQDIINGDTPKESLKLHIELWIKNGCPHYSGKILSK